MRHPAGHPLGVDPGQGVAGGGGRCQRQLQPGTGPGQQPLFQGGLGGTREQVGDQLAVAHLGQPAGALLEQGLGLPRLALLQQDLGHVAPQLGAHPDVLEGFEQPQAALRVPEGGPQLTGQPVRNRQPFIDSRQARHVQHIAGSPDRRLVFADRLVRLAGDVVQVGLVAQDAGLQQRVVQPSRLIRRPRLLEPAAGFVRAAEQVVGGAHPVV